MWRDENNMLLEEFWVCMLRAEEIEEDLTWWQYTYKRSVLQVHG